MSLVIAVLVLAFVGAWPVWPHSRAWGYGPSGIVGITLSGILALLAAVPL
jgi:hypothetical protein